MWQETFITWVHSFSCWNNPSMNICVTITVLQATFPKSPLLLLQMAVCLARLLFNQRSNHVCYNGTVLLKCNHAFMVKCNSDRNETVFQKEIRLCTNKSQPVLFCGGQTGTSEFILNKPVKKLKNMFFFLEISTNQVKTSSCPLSLHRWTLD